MMHVLSIVFFVLVGLFAIGLIVREIYRHRRTIGDALCMRKRLRRDFDSWGDYR